VRVPFASLRNVLILLPPSEGKTAPPAGPRLDLRAMSFPALSSTRRTVLAAVVSLCRTDPGTAAQVLGLGPTQHGDITTDARLRSASCAPAIDVYSGVLYESLDHASLTAAVRRRSQQRLAIASALWGLVRPCDLIPAYRLSGSVTIPGLGPLSRVWREHVSAVLGAEDRLIVDLRSSAYLALGPVPAAAAGRAASVRVLQERDGRRMVVSHSNKATKGRIARTLVSLPKEPATVGDLVAELAAAGYRVERPPAKAGHPSLVDVIIDQP
jgi:cytoplasmic iron level regulating protein YaaA (DUF328/UPF0246 family)